MRWLQNILAGIALLAIADPALAQGGRYLKSLSLEELANIEVTTVSRGSETLAHTPAAVYVITGDDIHRSGAATIPEALRLAPGVHVARNYAGHWAIGIRGFTSALTRSVLVLMDGRAVYDPLFAGTYWDMQDTLLEDVDRIEVIRGPGGTLWGANAINGIINIITKPASETQGAVATGQVSSTEDGSIGFRYGGMASRFSYRAYGKSMHRSSVVRAQGLQPEYDEGLAGQGGFRIDKPLAHGRSLTIQGDGYRARSGELAQSTTYASRSTVIIPYDAMLSGGNVLMRWSSSGNAEVPFQLQAYYDRTNRHEVPVKENRDTLDVDFQQTRVSRFRQELVWGLGYRATSSRIVTIAPTLFVPDSRLDHLSSGFVQDTIALVPGRLRVSGGVKLEHNSYSGFEIQPSGRLVWTLNATNTVVGSVTRAVRTPAAVETDYTTISFAGLTQGLGTFVRLQPNPAFVPEKLTASELGYRVQPAKDVYVSVSSFYNQLDDILSTNLLTPFFEPSPVPPHLILPVEFANGLQGNTYGVEVTADVRATPWWRVTMNYSHVRVTLSKTPGSTDVSAERDHEGSSPRHQWQIRSALNLRASWSADWSLRYVSDLPAGSVPSYATSDLRLAWQLSPRLELAAIGQDLHHARHAEWAGAAGNVNVPRRVYTRVTWRP